MKKAKKLENATIAQDHQCLPDMHKYFANTNTSHSFAK